MDRTRSILKKAELSILDEFDRVCNANNLKYYLFFGTLLGAVRHNGFIPWDDDIDVVMPRDDYKRLLNLDRSAFGDRFYLQKPSESDKWGGVFSKIRLKDTLFIIDSSIVLPNEIADKWKQYGVFIDIFPLDNTKGFCILNRIRVRFANAISAYIHHSVNGKKLSKRIAILGKALMFFTTAGLFSLRDYILAGKGKYYICYGGTYDLKHKTFDKKWFQSGETAKFEGKCYPVPVCYDSVLRTLYGSDYMELPSEEKRVNHNPVYLRFNDIIIDNRRFDENANS